jgi:hypothetical protein
MLSHIGTAVYGGLSPEKEAAIVEELGGQYLSSTMDPNFPFEQGMPWFMPNLLT